MIRHLSPLELKTIYHQHMKDDFPADELKPLTSIEHQMKKGQCFCLGYAIEGKLCGYAILEHCHFNRCLLLDYFAIFHELRATGLGSQFLQELLLYFKDWQAILIESETVTNSTSAKRLTFYQRCGARITSIQVHLYHVDYHILILMIQEEMADEQILTALQQLYQAVYPWLFRKLYLRLKQLPSQ